ncbi:MAG: PilN domain-containing protein [Candidatus Omnitrophica bacterium]|nr:PilN domain-containing protein [Candidatus Omnitrophota bacterium]
MIKINLLPDELKKQRVMIPKGLLAASGLVVGLLLFIFYVSINQACVKEKNKLNELESKWKEILVIKGRLGKCKRTLEGLNERSTVVNYLMTDRISCSKKLNELSDLMIDGIWLTKLKFDQKVLVIEGKVYSEKGNEEALVGNFMNNIKGHKYFFGDFKDIELRIIKRKEGDIEYVSFVVFCSLKEKVLMDESGKS